MTLYKFQQLNVSSGLKFSLLSQVMAALNKNGNFAKVFTMNATKAETIPKSQQWEVIEVIRFASQSKIISNICTYCLDKKALLCLYVSMTKSLHFL